MMSWGPFQPERYCDSKYSANNWNQRKAASMVGGTILYLDTCTPYRTIAAQQRQNLYKHQKYFGYQCQQPSAQNRVWRVKTLSTGATKPDSLRSKEKTFHISTLPEEPWTLRWSKAWLLAKNKKPEADRKTTSHRTFKGPGSIQDDLSQWPTQGSRVLSTCKEDAGR